MIQVPVTVVGQGTDRVFEFDCPHCGKRLRAGRHGIADACKHPAYLNARKFDDVVAVFEDKPPAG